MDSIQQGGKITTRLLLLLLLRLLLLLPSLRTRPRVILPICWWIV
jgi:hypothetical protein